MASLLPLLGLVAASTGALAQDAEVPVVHSTGPGLIVTLRDQDARASGGGRVRVVGEGVELALELRDDGRAPDATASDGVFTVQAPGALPPKVQVTLLDPSGGTRWSGEVPINPGAPRPEVDFSWEKGALGVKVRTMEVGGAPPPTAAGTQVSPPPAASTPTRTAPPPKVATPTRKSRFSRMGILAVLLGEVVFVGALFLELRGRRPVPRGQSTPPTDPAAPEFVEAADPDDRRETLARLATEASRRGPVLLLASVDDAAFLSGALAGNPAVLSPEGTAWDATDVLRSARALSRACAPTVIVGGPGAFGDADPADRDEALADVAASEGPWRRLVVVLLPGEIPPDVQDRVSRSATSTT